MLGGAGAFARTSHLGEKTGINPTKRAVALSADRILFHPTAAQPRPRPGRDPPSGQGPYPTVGEV